MGRLRTWSRSIGRRYMLASVLLITILILVSYLFSAWYMAQSTEEKLLEDYQAAMEFSARQIARYQADLDYISTLLVSDEELQMLLAEMEKKSEAVKVKNSVKIYEILRKYELLRSDCICVELLLADGQVFTSDSHNVNSLHSVGDNTWLEELDWEKNRDFSGAHAMQCKNIYYNDTITYSCNVGNYYTNNRKIGKLLIHIRQEALEELVYAPGPEYAWCAVMNSDGEILAESGEKREETETELTNTDKEQMFCRTEDIINRQEANKGIYEDSNGWLLYDQELDNGLQMVMYMSKERLHSEEQNILLFFLLLFVICLFFSCLLMLVISKRLSKPIVALSNAARQISVGKLDVHIQSELEDEIGTLTESFNQMAASIEQQMHDLQKAERVRSNLQMSILMAQINPHFIYNTLNSAIYLSKVGETQKAAHLLQLFIRLLQNNMKSGIDGMITTIGEDICDLKGYVELQGIRYPGRFGFTVEVQEGLSGHAIPRLMLQPLVENALNHGVLSREYGEIKLNIYKKDNYIVFELSDDGDGMDEQKIKEILSEKELNRSQHSSRVHSISIGNIRQRLSLIYKEDYSFEIRSYPGEGTTIYIQVPIEFKTIR